MLNINIDSNRHALNSFQILVISPVLNGNYSLLSARNMNSALHPFMCAPLLPNSISLSNNHCTSLAITLVYSIRCICRSYYCPLKCRIYFYFASSITIFHYFKHLFQMTAQVDILHIVKKELLDAIIQFICQTMKVRTSLSTS